MAVPYFPSPISRYYNVPSDFDTDAQGNFYIADPVNRRIVVLSAAGRWREPLPLRWDPSERVGSTFLAVQPSGEHIVIRNLEESKFAFCRQDRRGKQVECARFPVATYSSGKRSIGITATGTIYGLAFHRTDEQFATLFEYSSWQAPPREVLSTRRKRAIEGPLISDFVVGEEGIIVAMNQEDETGRVQGKYILIRPGQPPKEFAVPAAAAYHLIGFAGRQVAGLEVGPTMKGPDILHLVTLKGEGQQSEGQWTLPYPTSRVFWDPYGPKLVHRMAARERILAMAATSRGLLLAEYVLPPGP